MSGIYVHGAPIYRAAGWTGVLPLPENKKTPPPTGYTGHKGVDPTDEQIAFWVATEPNGNLCLRLPRGVIALDLDFYGEGDKEAKYREAHEAAEAEWGELPATWCATSRDNGSGKYLYRIPEDVVLDGDAPGGEVVQHHHRYVVAWPSTNPADGDRVVLWVDPTGKVSGRVPSPDELPWLPDTWLEGLRKDRRIERAAGERSRWQGVRGELSVRPEIVLAGISEGSRNKLLFKYACSLRNRNADQAEAVALLDVAMKACTPPYEDESAKDLVDRVWDTYPPGEDATGLYGEPDETLDPLMVKADRRIRLTWREQGTWECKNPSSVLVLQHMGTGRIRTAPVTCRTWGCDACRLQRTLNVLGGLSAAIGAEGCYIYRGEGKKTTRSVARSLQRRNAKYLRVSRGERFYIFADQAPAVYKGDTGWRKYPPIEALLVARRALSQGVTRVGGDWVNKPLKPVHRGLGIAGPRRVVEAFAAAEERLREQGINYSLDSDEDPPNEVKDLVGEFVIDALNTVPRLPEFTLHDEPEFSADATLQDVLAGAA